MGTAGSVGAVLFCQVLGDGALPSSTTLQRLRWRRGLHPVAAITLFVLLRPQLKKPSPNMHFPPVKRTHS